MEHRITPALFVAVALFYTAWLWGVVCWVMSWPMLGIALAVTGVVAWCMHRMQVRLWRLSVVHNEALRLAAFFGLAADGQQLIATGLWANLWSFLALYEEQIGDQLCDRPLYARLVFMGGVNERDDAWGVFVTHNDLGSHTFQITGCWNQNRVTRSFGSADSPVQVVKLLMHLGATVDDLKATVEAMAEKAGLTVLIEEPTDDLVPAA
jgi:hypothetical protein